MSKNERRFWLQFTAWLAAGPVLGLLLVPIIRASTPEPVETPAPAPAMRVVEVKAPETAPVEPAEVAELVLISEPEPEPAPAYTAEELELLALVIYQEAGGDACSDETRRMVGEVAMNRVADWRYPDTLYGVLTQRAQYGRLHWTGPVWPERAALPQEAHAVARAYTIAEQVLTGDRLLPADTVYQAEFTQGAEVVAHLDGIYFCR